MPDDLVKRLREYAEDWRVRAASNDVVLEAASRLSDGAVEAAVREERGVYIASKTKHGPRWRDMRAAGAPIISTWIDEAEAGATSDWPGLWRRCVGEASRAAVTIVYAEAGEMLKGGWVEVGAALAHGRRVIAVVADEFTVFHHPGIERAATIEEAFARAALSAMGGGDTP